MQENGGEHNVRGCGGRCSSSVSRQGAADAMESVPLVAAPPGKGEREGGLLNIFARLEPPGEVFRAFSWERQGRECVIASS